MRRHFLIFLIITAVFQRLTANEAVIEPSVQSMFEIGKQQVQKGEYEDATNTFLSLLTPKKLMPDELAFYFGKSLYHKGNNKRVSIDFLKKYLSLRGDTAKHYDETIAMLKAMGEYKEDKAKDTRTTAQKQLDKCRENSYTVCPICHGKNTLTSPTAFGSSFRECNYCDKRGLMPCENYSKYINEGVLVEYKKQ